MPHPNALLARQKSLRDNNINLSTLWVVHEIEQEPKTLFRKLELKSMFHYFKMTVLNTSE